MTTNTANRGRWIWICIAIAVVYALPVAFAVWSNFPTERQILADAAWSAIAAVQQHDEKYKPLTPQAVRRRLYRGLTDEQILARVRDLAAAEEHHVKAQASRSPAAGDQAITGLYTGSPDYLAQLAAAPELTQVVRPQIAVTMEQVDKHYAARMASLPASRFKTIAWGIVAWVVPVLLLFFFAPRFSWPRRKDARRF